AVSFTHSDEIKTQPNQGRTFMSADYSNIHPQPQTRKGLAIASLVLVIISIPTIVVGAIIAAVIVPQLLKKESSPIQTLRTIHYCQATFQATKQRFGTLKELSEAGCIDSSYANGSPVSGYIYTSIEVTQDSYCVQATRQAPSTSSRDFNVIEDGAIRYVES